MPFLIQDGQLPATFTAGPMTDDDFAALCADHPDLSFEIEQDARQFDRKQDLHNDYRNVEARHGLADKAEEKS